METTTPSPIIKPRSIKTASRLSDLAYGLGQIYCGHLVRGLFIYFVGVMIVMACVMMIALMKGRFLQAFLMGAVPATALWLFAKFDARRLAAKSPPDYALKEYNRWYVYAMLVVIILPMAVCGAFFIREKAYEAFKVVTDRMSPTIRDGERVLVNKTIYDVEPMRRGDVVIVRSPNAIRWNLVQRLVGLPGDKIELRGGEVLVNGEPVVHPGGASSTQPDTRPPGEAVKWTLPSGHGFFISDNRGAKLDGHDLDDLGEAPLSNVVGRAEFIYWPRLAKAK